MPKPLTLDDLPGDLPAFANRELAAGRSETVEGVLRAGLEELADRELFEQDGLEIVRAAWLDGAAAVGRGDPIKLTSEQTATLVERLKLARLRAAIDEGDASGEFEGDPSVQPTGATLIDAMQTSPHRDVDLEPERVRLPVDEVEDLS